MFFYSNIYVTLQKMKTLYLIRHTTPNIETSICYGSSDIDVTKNFLLEADDIRKLINSTNPISVFSSPLIRCSKLAKELFPNHSIIYEDDIKELDFGDWEMQSWDQINKNEINRWYKDFMNIAPPNGESFMNLYSRSTNKIYNIFNNTKEYSTDAIITHSGVIRCILMEYLHIPANKIFNWHLGYGCIVKLSGLDSNYIKIEILKG